MYADETYYKVDYAGDMVPDDVLDSYLSKASDIVDQLTLFRIAKRGFDNLTEFQKRYVRLAVCTQADYMYGSAEMPDWVQSYSVGSVSVSRSDKDTIHFSSQAIGYLRSTGLMYRGLR